MVKSICIRQPEFMSQSSSPQTRNLPLDFILLLCITALAVLELSPLLFSQSFGSEFTQFFVFTHDRPFSKIADFYFRFKGGWYRPTQFFLPYWLGDGIFNWHHPTEWRAYELATLLMVCALIYWFVLVLLPGR